VVPTIDCPFMRQIAKFKAPANATQARYGIRSQPAAGRIRPNWIAVSRMANHKIEISIKPGSSLLK